MARFLLSPGVLTREVDNSQYTSTQPAGNVAALVGYAEKGPFEPYIVSGVEDFVQVYGKTLADAPYLAQAAYKYFAQGQSLLVTRAGDNRDPELYPQAAQYASKKIRLGETDLAASAAYQAFTANNNIVPAGTFATETDFGFKVIADHRAFLEPQIVETWEAYTHETTNSVSAPHPASEVVNQVIKIAYNNLSDNNFKINYKYKSLTTDTTSEDYGTGVRVGDGTIGSTVTSTVYRYRMNGAAPSSGNNSYVMVNGTYGAVALSSNTISAAFDFNATPEDLVFVLDNVNYTITLDMATTDEQDIVNQINTKLITAEDSNGTIVDLSNDLEAFLMYGGVVTGTRIGLRRKATVIASGASTGFTIVNSELAVRLGFSLKTYNDNEYIYGTWNAENNVGTFSGNLLLQKKGIAENNVETFVEPLDIVITSPASSDWTYNDMIVDIQTQLEAGYTDYTHDRARANVSIVDNKIRITTDSVAADGFKSIVRIQNSGANSLIDLLTNVDQPVDGIQASPIGTALVNLIAAEKGVYGNKLVLRTETKQVQVSATEVEFYYNAFVLLDGKEVSIYQRINWDDPTSDKYLPKVLENDRYLHMEAEDEDGDFVTFASTDPFPNGDWTLGDDELPENVFESVATIVDFSVGSNGWTEDSDGVITSMDTDLINALKKIYNPEVYDFNMVAAPGAAASAVQNEIQTLCESRHDCFGIIDAAPFGMGLGVKEKLNHVSEINSMNENLNSSYVGTYWPWLQDYDADNKQYVWLPPSIYAMTQMVYTDNVADPWYAAAGLRRGKVTALDVEYSPTRAERDILYGDTNVINPIVKLVGEGIVIWGQKTAQRTKSALDRINVRRLMIYSEKLIARMARGFLFEQNDASNWAAFARQANAILEPIRQRRGLYQYQVICDATTNTSDLINQNIMAGKIFVQPTKVIEFIEVEFTINAAGDVEFSE